MRLRLSWVETQAAEFRDKMKRFYKIILGIMALLLIGSMLCACGDVTNQDPKMWPKKGPASSVPEPKSGELDQAVTKEDNNGNVLSIIKYTDFSVADMSDYVRLLEDKKFSIVQLQTEVGDYVLSEAEKKDIRVSLRLNKIENTMIIEIEKF